MDDYGAAYRRVSGKHFPSWLYKPDVYVGTLHKDSVPGCNVVEPRQAT